MYQDLIRDTEIYQFIMQEGVQQGFQRTILSLFQRDFPELLALATERITTISDLDLLQSLVLDITTAKSVEQVHAILNTLTPNE